jgi:hypothetical protein
LASVSESTRTLRRNEAGRDAATEPTGEDEDDAAGERDALARDGDNTACRDVAGEAGRGSEVRR